MLRRLRSNASVSAVDAVAEVSHAGGVDDPSELQLGVVGIEMVEETAALTEEDRDQVNLDLVEDAGGERELRGSGAVDEHLLVARSLLGRSHRLLDVAHVRDQRPVRLVGVGFTAGGKEEGDAG